MLVSTRVETARKPVPVLADWAAAIRRCVDVASADRLPYAVADTLRGGTALGQLLDARQQQGSAEHYTRHVLHADPAGLFTIVALVWRPGQATPVHGHYTWCAYTVLKGRLEEEQFAWNRQTSRADYQGRASKLPGDTVAGHAGLDQIHRLRNAGTDTAVSIHVYGVAGPRVATHVNRVVASA